MGRKKRVINFMILIFMIELKEQTNCYNLEKKFLLRAKVQTPFQYSLYQKYLNEIKNTLNCVNLC